MNSEYDTNKPLRVMSIMAHQDDFEFNLGGSFAILKESLGDLVDLSIVTTSTGASGHHEMKPEDVFVRRCKEAQASAKLIGAKYECLKQLDGSYVDGQVLLSRNLLGGLWNAIRKFDADVVFCPPVVSNPLDGVHIDHEQTAQALRYVAYQLSVPHAYPTMEGVDLDINYRTPLFINIYDNYIGTDKADISQDISTVYDRKLKMSLCHKSQVLEWLPFNGGWDLPMNEKKWEKRFWTRHIQINKRYGIDDDTPREYFIITRWGREPYHGELERLFPLSSVINTHT